MSETRSAIASTRRRADAGRTFLRIVAIALLGCLAACASSSDAERPAKSKQPRSERKASTTTPTSVRSGPPGDGWQVILDESFDSGRLDPFRWATCYWWSDSTCTNAGNNELELYTPNNVTFGNSRLQLVARREPGSLDGQAFAYSSGMISGSGRQGTMFPFRYGYIETRARVPSGAGLWSAFWLLNANQEALPEIDVFEIVGEDPVDVQQSVHLPDDDGERRRVHEHATMPAPTDGWHVYGLRWDESELTWYIDGRETFSVDDDADIPHVEMYLIANLAVGGDFTVTPDGRTPFPSQLELDYIRVWQQR